MSPASNDAELIKMISKDIEKCTDSLGQFALNQIIQSVWSEVYSYIGSGKYHRQGMKGGFIGSWKKKTTPFNGTEITSEIASDPTSMVLDEDNFIHGSKSGGDRRADLPRLIQEGLGYDWNFSLSRDYWTLIEDMTSNGVFDQVFEAEMHKRGIIWI
jgi:hypothetical protein